MKKRNLINIEHIPYSYCRIFKSFINIFSHPLVTHFTSNHIRFCSYIYAVNSVGDNDVGKRDAIRCEREWHLRDHPWGLAMQKGDGGGATSTRVNSRITRAAPAALECGREGWRWLQIASITLAAVHRFRVSPPSRSRTPGIARISLRTASDYCVWNDYGGLRYEVAGSRKAVRHLDWPVGSYKRREAREDARAIMSRCRGGSWWTRRRRCRKPRVSFAGAPSPRKLFKFITAFLVFALLLPKQN